MLTFRELPKTDMHTVFVPVELQTDIMHQLNLDCIAYIGKRWNQYQPKDYEKELGESKTFYSNYRFGNRYCMLRVPFSPADFYQHTLQFFGPTQDPELRIRTQKEAARTMHCYHTYVEPHEANIEPNDTSLKDRP